MQIPSIPTLVPTGGTDSGDFTCTVSATAYTLAFTSTPDFENPADANTDNVYSVTVTINDGEQDGNTMGPTR